jgi:hypothetical protein
MKELGKHQGAGRAWYEASREKFLEQTREEISDSVHRTAVSSGWFIEPEQLEEWQREVELLHHGLGKHLKEPVKALHQALTSPALVSIRHVILEYDFRRRGVRMDAILLGDGVVIVLEFKRSELDAASRDQVMHYAINLLEFHQETRRLVEQGALVVPMLVRTSGAHPLFVPDHAQRLPGPWAGILAAPIRSDRSSLEQALIAALAAAPAAVTPCADAWLRSDFDPSSSIVDAAISLWGDHEVTAIREHASSVQDIKDVTAGIRRQIDSALSNSSSTVVLVSGAPGAGKTLVALNLAFDSKYRSQAVMVTGNAPLVEVLSEALKRSYGRGLPASAVPSTDDLSESKGKSSASAKVRRALLSAGYPMESARAVVEMATFPIEKAHRFLGETGSRTGSAAVKIVLFDEAQRTYRKGREVARNRRLEDDEAVLILRAMKASNEGASVVVAFLGENQAINDGELGAEAWLIAADREGWDFAVSDRTLQLPELATQAGWASHPKRKLLLHGHLGQSMRFYRNASLERWAGHVLDCNANAAREIADALHAEGHTVWLTREVDTARQWVRSRRVGQERAGIVASSQARRLAAYGLQVDQKPDIAHWMLAPSGDCRSSNMLESVQNEYQIQGLELDWTILCWGTDLRFSDGCLRAFSLSGTQWQQRKSISSLAVSKNRYRVLLTRARKGMVIVVPHGDKSAEDPTRNPNWDDSNFAWLLSCGARQIE